jgi:ketosteroid isomerase-like protein
MKMLMKTVLVLVGCVSVDPVLAQPPRAHPEGSSVAGTIKQRERDWANAMMAFDVDKLSQIFADDWVETDGGPRAITKASNLDYFRSRKHKLETCEFGPEDVKVFGNVAVVQGSVTESWTTDGQTSSSHVTYMDVWEKQGDSWVVVRSHAARTKL